MALLITSRTAQNVLSAHFQFEHDDTMVPKAGGAAADFGLTNTSATTVVAIPLPPNSVVVGGAVARRGAFAAAAYGVTVGAASDADRSLASSGVQAVGSTVLVSAGYVNETGENVELTFTAADACTTGKCILRVDYIVLDRANEVQIA